MPPRRRGTSTASTRTVLPPTRTAWTRCSLSMNKKTSPSSSTTPPGWCTRRSIRAAKHCWTSTARNSESSQILRTRNPGPVRARPTRSTAPWSRSSTPTWVTCSPTSSRPMTRAGPGTSSSRTPTLSSPRTMEAWRKPRVRSSRTTTRWTVARFPSWREAPGCRSSSPAPASRRA